MRIFLVFILSLFFTINGIGQNKPDNATRGTGDSSFIETTGLYRVLIPSPDKYDYITNVTVVPINSIGKLVGSKMLIGDSYVFKSKFYGDMLKCLKNEQDYAGFSYDGSPDTIHIVKPRKYCVLATGDAGMSQVYIISFYGFIRNHELVVVETKINFVSCQVCLDGTDVGKQKESDCEKYEKIKKTKTGNYIEKVISTMRIYKL